MFSISFCPPLKYFQNISLRLQRGVEVVLKETIVETPTALPWITWADIEPILWCLLPSLHLLAHLIYHTSTPTRRYLVSATPYSLIILNNLGVTFFLHIIAFQGKKRAAEITVKLHNNLTPLWAQIVCHLLVIY